MSFKSVKVPVRNDGSTVTLTSLKVWACKVLAMPLDLLELRSSLNTKADLRRVWNLASIWAGSLCSNCTKAAYKSHLFLACNVRTLLRRTQSFLFMVTIWADWVAAYLKPIYSAVMVLWGKRATLGSGCIWCFLQHQLSCLKPVLKAVLLADFGGRWQEANQG